jgi:hypothetical protein
VDKASKLDLTGSTKPTKVSIDFVDSNVQKKIHEYIDIVTPSSISNVATLKANFDSYFFTDKEAVTTGTTRDATDGFATFLLNVVKMTKEDKAAGGYYDGGNFMLAVADALSAVNIPGNEALGMCNIIVPALKTAILTHLSQVSSVDVPISINSGRTYKGELLWTPNRPIENIILQVENISLTRVYCTTNGYRINHEALELEREKWSVQPFVYPGQTVDIISFSVGPTETGINTVIQYGFRSCTNIILLFPATSSQHTCYHNPHYKEVQITALGQNYPDKAVQTINDPQFAILQTIQNDFMFNEKNQEYADSMTMMRTDGDNLIQPLRDTTSFALTIKTERWSANGLIEDGLDTGGKNTSVRLNALPIYQNYNDIRHPKRDPFYGEKNESEPLHAPLMCCVQDIAIVFKMTPRGGECAWLVRNFEEGIAAFMASGASSQ